MDWDEYDDFVSLDIDYVPVARPADERPARFDRSWSHYADDCPVSPARPTDDRLRKALLQVLDDAVAEGIIGARAVRAAIATEDEP